MRWAIYILAVLVAVAIDSSLGGVLKIGDAQPRFLACVVVYAILSAPRAYAVRIAMLANLPMTSSAILADCSLVKACNAKPS